MSLLLGLVAIGVLILLIRNETPTYVPVPAVTKPVVQPQPTPALVPGTVTAKPTPAQPPAPAPASTPAPEPKPKVTKKEKAVTSYSYKPYSPPATKKFARWYIHKRAVELSRKLDELGEILETK